ncbi:hypothetical protein [Pseudomonas asiatica]|uniref:hypothetical protein n=1 Tax=Pseudomonas asiatica TaxID=2219225 RepID=UPI00201683C2|nr:hypothetical protein [Pseudomonas asiatica]
MFGGSPQADSSHVHYPCNGRLSTIQSYAWTLELLGEALVQHDEMLECEHNPHLSFRNTAGIHQAIRIISRLASEQCGKVMERNGQDPVS